MQEVANGVTTVYQYDLNGNTIPKTTGSSQVRYYWDDEDKMVRVEDSVVMNFKTDGLGFRRMKEVVGQGQTWFVYDLGESETPGLAPLVAEYDQNGNLVAKYHHDGGGLMAMTRNNTSYWYAFEAIGTTRQMMDGQGQVSDAYAFDAWGNAIAISGTTINPFRYIGMKNYYTDTSSNLMLLGIRYYNPMTGRFLSIDPFQDQFNWYVYTLNNPVNRIDPSGLKLVVVDPSCHRLNIEPKLDLICIRIIGRPDLFGGVNDRLFHCMSNICSSGYPVICIRCPMGGRGCTGVCGGTDDAPLPGGCTFIITICQVTPPCPSLDCLLIHELTHACAWHKPESDSEKIAEACENTACLGRSTPPAPGEEGGQCRLGPLPPKPQPSPWPPSGTYPRPPSPTPTCRGSAFPIYD